MCHYEEDRDENGYEAFSNDGYDHDGDSTTDSSDDEIPWDEIPSCFANYQENDTRKVGPQTILKIKQLLSKIYFHSKCLGMLNFMTQTFNNYNV